LRRKWQKHQAAARRGTLSLVWLESKNSGIAAISHDFQDNASRFLCTSDLLVERAEFELSLEFLPRHPSVQPQAEKCARESANLGPPTTKHGNTLIFDHEHQETIRNEAFTVSNGVDIELRSGVVWTVQVWKTTSD
jgi:hypothetical protein